MRVKRRAKRRQRDSDDEDEEDEEEIKKNVFDPNYYYDDGDCL